MRVAVIADDLTGAADTGVQLAARRIPDGGGLPRRAPSRLDHFDAVAADTDSRALPSGGGRARARPGRPGRCAAPLLLYKKVDSTLRGPVAAELGAALDAGGRSAGLLAPAFPPAGRTTRGGVQLVDGRPVHETASPTTPPGRSREARLPALLEAARLGPVEVLPALERPDPERVGRPFRSGAARGRRRDRGAPRGARALVADPGDVLWVGRPASPARSGACTPAPGTGEPSEAPAPEGPALVVIGSAHPEAREQVARLAAEPDVWPSVDAAALGAAERGAAADPLADALGGRERRSPPATPSCSTQRVGRRRRGRGGAASPRGLADAAASSRGAPRRRARADGRRHGRARRPRGSARPASLVGGRARAGRRRSAACSGRARFPSSRRPAASAAPDALRACQRGARPPEGGPGMSAERVIAITMGDPAGIGPEIVAKVFAEGDGGDARRRRRRRGDDRAGDRAGRRCRCASTRRASPRDAALRAAASIDVLADDRAARGPPFGEVDARAGDARLPLRAPGRRARARGRGARRRHRAAQQGGHAPRRATATPATPSSSPS